MRNEAGGTGVQGATWLGLPLYVDRGNVSDEA